MSEWTEPTPDDPESIKQHLDEMIEHYRAKDDEVRVDLLQSVRKNIFDEVKP